MSLWFGILGAEEEFAPGEQILTKDYLIPILAKTALGI